MRYRWLVDTGRDGCVQVQESFMQNKRPSICLGRMLHKTVQRARLMTSFDDKLLT